MGGRTESDIEQLWAAALEDAERYGVPRSKLYMFPFEGKAPQGEDLATLFDPDQRLFRQPTFPVEDAAVLKLANSDEAQQGYRVAVFTDYDQPVLLGRLRHELEHVRQWERHGRPLFEFERFIVGALHHVIDETKGASYYNLIPSELDANAATSRFLRSNLQRPEIETLLSDSDNINLIRFLAGPQDIDTLPSRMLCFALLFLDGCQAYAQSQYESDFESAVSERWGTLVPNWMSSRFGR